MSNAGQGVTAFAGGVIGFFVGGPGGAVAGFQLGLAAGTALFPTQLPGVEGPRLEDLEKLQADPGAPVFQVFGSVPVPGFRMYLGPVTEVSSTEDVGGKGAPEQEVTSFSYFQTLGIGLAEGPISGVARIWENGSLVYDPRPQQPDETSDEYLNRFAMSVEYAETFTLYRGDESQLADPQLELELGVGNVPAFRGLAYLVFPDRQLKPEQANRHPNMKIEVLGKGELVLTSRPYAIEILESLDATAESQNGNNPPDIQEALSVTTTLLAGALDTPVVTYENYAAEGLSVTADLLDGDLSVVLLSYDNYDSEAIDITTAMLDSSLRVALVEYGNYDPESLDVTAAALDGTLTIA